MVINADQYPIQYNAMVYTLKPDELQKWVKVNASTKTSKTFCNHAFNKGSKGLFCYLQFCNTLKKHNIV